MVRVLIGLRRAVARHQLTRASTAALVVTSLLVLVTAVAILLTGWVSYAREATATDVLALVSLLWIGGRIAQSALSSEPFLRPEMFSLLLLLPFAGTITVVIAAACACNLYGDDGSSVWLTVMTPGSARADIRGRQAGWLIAVGPYAVASTIILTALSGQPQAWPWAPGLLTAILGGGAGLSAIGSLVCVQPLDAAGNPTPAWSLKVYVALAVVPLTVVPTALVLVAGGGWLAVPASVLTGTALTIWLGRLAVTRLADHQVSILHALAGAA